MSGTELMEEFPEISEFPKDVSIDFVNSVYVVNIWNCEAVEHSSEVQAIPIVTVGERTVVLGDITSAQPFQTFVNKLAKQLYKNGSSFICQVNAIKRASEVKVQMTIAVATNEKGQPAEIIGKNIVLKNGVEVQINPETIVIRIPDLAECPECGQKFTPRRKDQLYCSKLCRDRVAARGYRERKKAAQE